MPPQFALPPYAVGMQMLFAALLIYARDKLHFPFTLLGATTLPCLAVCVSPLFRDDEVYPPCGAHCPYVLRMRL
eukprot:4465438-Pleurochrysis_carterae.AAC.1